MKHRATPKFWRLYHSLPDEIRDLADKNFALLSENPKHRSLHFKQVGEGWSVRIGRDYRAFALKNADGYDWAWIGPHDEYDKLLR